MIKRRPPQHSADATPIFIASSDDAWDKDRVARERAALPKGDRHPLDDYYAGRTRFDLDAPLTLSGQTVTIRDYLREGAAPTVFRLRRVTGLERQQAKAAFQDKGEAAADRRLTALWKLARAGVVEVVDGFDGKPWDIEGGGGLPLTEADAQQLYDADPMLVEELGYAVYFASAPLSEAEGKR